MKKNLLILIVVATSQALLASHPFNLSLTPDAQIVNSKETIEGVTLGIWGKNVVRGLSLNFVSETTGNSVGFMWSLVNLSEKYEGVQWAIVNYNRGSFLGWQGGVVNYDEGPFTGLQTGFVNYAANKMCGLQFGLLNIAKNMDRGVQIGLINIIENNKHWFSNVTQELAPGMIFVNWRF